MTDEKYIKQNGALINTDDRAYHDYMQRKKRFMSNQKQVDNINQRMDSLESNFDNLNTDIQDIKSLLTQLLSK